MPAAQGADRLRADGKWSRPPSNSHQGLLRKQERGFQTR